MKIDRTKYTAHYENGVVVAQWVSVEMALDGANGESPMDALDRSQALVEQWYKSKNLLFESNSVPPGPPPIIQKQPEDRSIGLTPELIASCEDITTLQTFFMLVDKSNRIDLAQAYNKRKDELVAKESKEIIEAANKFTGRGLDDFKKKK